MRLRGGSHTGQAGGSSRLIRPVTEAPRRGDPRRNGPSPVPFDRTRLRENTSRESSKSGCRLRGRRQPGERGGVGSNADPVAFLNREMPDSARRVAEFQARYNHNHQVIFSATRPSGGTTGWTAGSQYFYDAQNRLSRQVEGNDSASEHLIYLESYEDRVGGYRTRSYVDDYAHLTRYRYGQLELRFLLTDRLGSVVSVVRADRDSGGYVTALEPETGLAYDVFGAPRHATTWARLGVNEAWPQAHNPWDVTPTTRHGFTGHEMLSKQRLIHMRGRLFDPRMGRFTGVDPVIQFPLSTQGLNPYSYLLNNPLAGTDPTGYKADWESVQERMWAMAGGYGAAGSTVTAVLSGMRSAAAAARASGSSGSVNSGGVASNGATTAQTVGTQSFTGGSAADLLSQSSGPQLCSIKDDPNAINGEHRPLTRGQSLRYAWDEFIGDLPLGSGGKSLYHLATDDVVQTITETIDGDYRSAGVSAAVSFSPWIKTAKRIGLDDAAESLLRRFGDDVLGRVRWKLGPNDIDLRGSGKGVRDAVDIAFDRVGLERSEFGVTRWGFDLNGKSFPTEWRHRNGAEINIDWSHSKNGPDVPHVGFQTGGKRGDGGAIRGHILLDDVPFNR